MKKSFSKKLVSFGIAIVVVLSAVEIALRIFPDIRPSSAQDRIEALYRIDPDAEPWWVDDKRFGYRVNPFLDDQISNIDYSYTRHTDRHGFHNKEWPQEADIVLLGDSLLNGIGVDIDKQISAVVGEATGETSVLNLSLSGATPLHLLRFYEDYAAPFRPAVVIAVIYAASDIDNAKHFDVWNRTGQKWSYNEFRARHYLDALASLTRESRDMPAAQEEADRSGLRQAASSLVNSLALGQELLYLSDPVRKGIIHDVDWPDGSEVFLYSRFQSRVRAGIGEEYPPVIDVFFEPLETLRERVTDDGGRFVVALIPSKEEIFVHEDESRHLRLVNEVRDQLDRRGFDVLDLYPAIREAAINTAPYFPHDIHFNETGNEAIGRAIAQWIEDEKALERSDPSLRTGEL